MAKQNDLKQAGDAPGTGYNTGMKEIVTVADIKRKNEAFWAQWGPQQAAKTDPEATR
jgi:hypothetical protein